MKPEAPKEDKGETMMGDQVKERREFADDVWVTVCMDEDIDYGPDVVAFGMVASGITRKQTGNQELLPDSKRDLLTKVGSVVHKHLKAAAEASGTNYLVTSHSGCGGGAAQGITEASELESVTAKMCQSLGVEFLGHIPHAENPVEVGNSNVTLHIGRPEAEHHHGARRVIITVGGGIKEAELQMLESDGYGDGFIVSADTLSVAISAGDISEAEALDYLELHLDIADGIADGVVKDTAAYVFNAGRLHPETALANHALVNKMLARLNKAK